MAPDEGALLTLELPARPEAAGAARRALEALNGSLHMIGEAHLRDAQAAMTELVTNAVVHGGDGRRPIRAEVRVDEQSLRVSVVDAGPGFDPARLPGPSHAGGGWWLRVVESLVRRWGVEQHTPTTWFEIDQPQS
jgi:anti-sigma regulatory factor (Ser/Thr protein kinase)